MTKVTPEEYTSVNMPTNNTNKKTILLEIKLNNKILLLFSAGEKKKKKTVFLCNRGKHTDTVMVRTVVAP